MSTPTRAGTGEEHHQTADARQKIDCQDCNTERRERAKRLLASMRARGASICLGDQLLAEYRLADRNGGGHE